MKLSDLFTDVILPITIFMFFASGTILFCKLVIRM